MEAIRATCRISLRNTVMYSGVEFQLPAEPFANWIGKTVETIWPANANHFAVRGLDGCYYDIDCVRLVVTDNAHRWIELPSGGTATVSPDALPATLVALDEMIRRARAALSAAKSPMRARRTKYMRLRRFMSRHFEREKINGGRRCPTYLFRWELLRLGGWALYLHEFVRDDWTTDLHDHPKRFVSVGLWGSYCEETPQGKRVYRAPWIRSFPATHIHRLSLIDGQRCWTLVLVLTTVREWGFWHAGVWSRWKDYLRSRHADAMKNCAE